MKKCRRIFCGDDFSGTDKFCLGVLLFAGISAIITHHRFFEFH